MPGVLRRFVLPSSPGAFRLWLALVVVFHHLSRLEIGKAPVLVFFALSGYWVQRVWTARYRHTLWPWVTFVVSRWWRIAPVMVLSAALSFFVLTWLGDGQASLVRSMPVLQTFSSLFLLGYAQMPVRLVGPAWSLDIEMQFYLLAPLIALGVRKLSPIVTLSFGYGVYLAAMALYPEVALPSFIFPFVLGMVAAQHKWTVPARVADVGQGLAIALVVLAVLSPWKTQLLDAVSDSYWPQFNLLLAALVLPQALVSVQQRSDSLDRTWADQSFVVYMLHWPVILLLRGMDWSGSGAGWWLGLALFTPVVASLCWAVHRFFDRPFNRARTRWVQARLEGVSGPVPMTKRDDSPAVLA